MNISRTIKNFKRLVDANAPVILTGVAVAGACLTTYLSAKGGMKSAGALDDAEVVKRTTLKDNSVDLTNTEKFIATYKFYAPAAVSLVGTVTCMVLATKIGIERTAAVAGAFVIAERANDQYRDKVKELLGENKHNKVVDATVADQAKNLVLPENLVLEGGKQIFVDSWTGRPIPTTMEKMNQALNEFNHELLYGDYASLTQFWKLVGLPGTSQSDDIGWNRTRLLELHYTPTLLDDRAVVYFTFDRNPMPDFQDYKEIHP